MQLWIQPIFDNLGQHCLQIIYKTKTLNLFPHKDMRQYYIDELSFLERDNLDSFLKRTLKASPIGGVFWLEMPQDLLAPAQLEHPDCGPFYCSVILDDTDIRFEFLVRSSHNMHCSCTAWATPAQRKFIMEFVDNMIEQEKIAV